MSPVGFLPARPSRAARCIGNGFRRGRRAFSRHALSLGRQDEYGLDCSGLVQVALNACGIACPRDSDMQERALGTPVDIAQARRGDLVFWKGHVAIVRDEAHDGARQRVSHGGRDRADRRGDRAYRGGGKQNHQRERL